MLQNSSSAAPRGVFIWLLICCAMIFIMALIGAITRLTESGLSITEWAPITGVLPPLNEAAWQNAFAAYQQIPQYKLLHHGMALAEFKFIFFWEWLHRLWGRLIGLVFLLPFIYFLAKKQIAKPLALRLLVIFALGGLQGFIGWFMVQSGLETLTHVSPYRLALHLFFALLVYSLLLWQAMQLTNPNPAKRSLKDWALLGLLSLTIIWGALVAGLHAGLAYNTWPLMNGTLLPEEVSTLSPLWLNGFENTALVQFIHRWLAPFTGGMIWLWATRQWHQTSSNNRHWLLALSAMVFVQIILGISTLLSEVNIALATLHQAGAIALLSLLLINLQRATIEKN